VRAQQLVLMEHTHVLGLQGAYLRVSHLQHGSCESLARVRCRRCAHHARRRSASRVPDRARGCCAPPCTLPRSKRGCACG
jgi:hypothetical protein